jgi:hypothetical protein
MKVMGMSPAIAYNANTMIPPGLGTVDEDSNLIRLH